MSVEPRTIDMTPSFEEATAMCITILENGNDEGKRNARSELLRYARELDRLASKAGVDFDTNDTPTSET